MQRERQHFAAEPAVAANHERLHALRTRAGGERHAQRAGEGGVDQVRHSAADVIGLENRGRELNIVAHDDSLMRGDSADLTGG
ncbi:hypothetical protein D3C81_1991440 [compost metagenome]